MPQVSCRVCRKLFHAAPSRLKKGKGVYCSPCCMRIGRSRPASVACLVCGGGIPLRRRKSEYCSRICACRAAGERGIGPRNCRWCGHRFTPLSAADYFCSSLCEARFMVEKGKVSLMRDPWTGASEHSCGDRVPDMGLGF